MEKYVNPASDIFIRYLLGSEKHKTILIDFINAVLSDSTPDFKPVEEISILNPFNLATLDKEKESILDVKARDTLNRIINIEIQVYSKDSFKERTLYYWAKLYSGQLKKGTDYSRLNPVICINVLDYTLFEGLKWAHNTFLLLDKRLHTVVLSEQIRIDFFELPKVVFNPKEALSSRLEKWAYFLKKEGKEEDEEELEQLLLEGDRVMKEAHDVYKDFTKNDDLVEIYEGREKYRRDWNASMSYAKKEGLKQGIQEGIEQGVEQGKQQMLLRLAEKKFQLTDSERKTIQTTTDSAKLDRAFDLLINAESFEEVKKELE